jgi:hypothetical protein
MTSFFARPKMLSTRTEGLRVGWRQGLYEKSGVGTLFLEMLEVEYECAGVPRKYFNEIRSAEDGVFVANQILRMYL